MTSEVHHYVPQWLQRRFLEKSSRLWLLDLNPETRKRPDGTLYKRKALLRWGPKRCFAQRFLYATGYTAEQIDFVEKEFFGEIDRNGARAIGYIVSGEYAPSNDYYSWFLRYLSVQKMRTPKGLLWLRSFASYAFGSGRSALELMSILQEIGEMHVTTWAESVWEVVKAPLPALGFILTDHPVTTYNCKAFPGSRHCRDHAEPPIELLGTRTILPLDSGHCLVISNQEFVESVKARKALDARSNPRAFGFAFFSPEHISRDRVLTVEETATINYILKKRALRYIAARESSWLSPEHSLRNTGWFRLDPVLRPKHPTLIKAISAEFSDGKRVEMDRLGRPLSAKSKEEFEDFERQVLRRNRRSRGDG